MILDNTKKYMEDKLESINRKIKVDLEKINSMEIEKNELFKEIELLENKIDEAHDVFSPKSPKNDFIKEQIENFQKRIDNINQLIEEYQQENLKYKEEKIYIEKGINEILELESEVINDSSSEENEKQEINFIDISKNMEEETSEFEEMIINKKIIRNIIYKCENCRAFINLDVNRSKLEIEAIIEELKHIISKNESEH